jgi:hypothetical protein
MLCYAVHGNVFTLHYTQAKTLAGPLFQRLLNLAVFVRQQYAAQQIFCE